MLVPRVMGTAHLGEFSPEIHRFGLTAGAEAKPGRESRAGLFQINPQSRMVVVPCCVVWSRDTPSPPFRETHPSQQSQSAYSLTGVPISISRRSPKAATCGLEISAVSIEAGP